MKHIQSIYKVQGDLLISSTGETYSLPNWVPIGSSWVWLFREVEGRLIGKVLDRVYLNTREVIYPEGNSLCRGEEVEVKCLYGAGVFRRVLEVFPPKFPLMERVVSSEGREVLYTNSGGVIYEEYWRVANVEDYIRTSVDLLVEGTMSSKDAHFFRRGNKYIPLNSKNCVVKYTLSKKYQIRELLSKNQVASEGSPILYTKK